MKRYDPNRAPDPTEWLELDEQERFLLLERFHRKAGDMAAEPKLHAIVHAIVENQLALSLAPVQAALDRLMREGLDRHEAIHAVGSVLIRHLVDAVKGRPATPNLNDAYSAELDELSAAKWRAG